MSRLHCEHCQNCEGWQPSKLWAWLIAAVMIVFVFGISVLTTSVTNHEKAKEDAVKTRCCSCTADELGRCGR